MGQKMHDFTLADQDWIGLTIFKNFADHDWIGLNFIGSGQDSDWKILQSAHLCWTVVYRIRLLESNPAGYLDFPGFGLDTVSLSTGSGFGLSKWNNMWPCKKSWYRTIVVWGKITIFRNHITKNLLLIVCNVPCRSGSKLSDWRHLKQRCSDSSFFESDSSPDPRGRNPYPDSNPVCNTNMKSKSWKNPVNIFD